MALVVQGSAKSGFAGERRIKMPYLSPKKFFHFAVESLFLESFRFVAEQGEFDFLRSYSLQSKKGNPFSFKFRSFFSR